MKYRNIATLVIIIFSVSIFASCKSTQSQVKQNSTYTDNSKNLDNVVSEYRNWNTFVTSGKISMSGSSMSSSMYMSMIYNKSITISIRPILGIEMGKLYITNDSLFLVDKFNKYFVAEKISAFTMGLPFNISAIQDLFLNRAFTINGGTLSSLDKTKVSVNTDLGNGEWAVTPKEQIAGYTYSFIFDKLNDLVKLSVKPKLGDGEYTVTYSDFAQVDFSRIAGSVDIAAKVNNTSFKLEFTINTGNAKWNQQVKNEGVGTPSYPKVSLLDYFKALKNQ